MRFGLNVTDPHARRPQPRPAPTLTGSGLRTTRTPDPQPWRLPLNELADIINVSFLDLAKVVTAHACGLKRTGLETLLYGPDHIHQSIDALTYALHDRQIQREMRILSRGHGEHTALLAGQQQALRNRLHESEQLLKQRRIAELTEAGALPLPPPTDDPRQLARAWLGRYLSDEKEALVHDIAKAAGVPSQKAAPIRSIRDKITKCIDSGWLTAPVSNTVQQLLTLDDHAFRRCLIEDASRQNDRDDNLCHPLVLNRWRDQLNAAIADLAPAAENPTTRHLHDLALTGTPRAIGRIDQLTGRRRLFASLLQRRSECVRLITDLNDTMTLAERADPSYSQLKRAADQAYDELVRRHPDLYHRIRAALAPYETRYGRLERRTPRAELRDQIFASLDKARG
ncbi:hypothetical protein ACFW9I_22745 [[Kitasatospora] papulosa]|uniref:hypothetical protein n=1 Tax=[Kitasatospora] papulosa TaxID=1464011 RepID=UPI0036C14BB5